MKRAEPTPETAMNQMLRIFKKRGTKALEMASKEMLQEAVESKEAREALTYFMTQFWHDLARPALLSMVCEAVGGKPEVTTPIGVPMILISGALSIHDDIIDKTKAKSGYPTVYGKSGEDVALLVGDALLFKGFFLLNTVTEENVPAKDMSLIMRIIKDMFFELGDAEAMELLHRGRIDVLPEKYLEIVRKKAADVEAHTRIGAILGGGTKEQIESMGYYGRMLGMMIILRDDWIDLMDLEESRNRLKRESLPLPILYALQDPNISSKLRAILLHDTLRKRDAQEILETIHNSEATKLYFNQMQELATRAVSGLNSAKSASIKHLELLVRATLPPSTETKESAKKNCL